MLIDGDPVSIPDKRDAQKEPVAYDVNEVLVQLEKSKHQISLSDAELEIYKSAIDDAIEIVKAVLKNQT